LEGDKVEDIISRIKEKISKLEEDVIEVRVDVSRMKEVDSNVFEKLKDIAIIILQNKESFEKHDEKEMEKYKSIEERLSKIERIMYMVMGAFILFQILNSLELLRFWL